VAKKRANHLSAVTKSYEPIIRNLLNGNVPQSQSQLPRNSKSQLPRNRNRNCHATSIAIATQQQNKYVMKGRKRTLNFRVQLYTEINLPSSISAIAINNNLNKTNKHVHHLNNRKLCNVKVLSATSTTEGSNNRYFD